ncbi:2393_t:CDS:10 [Cetraspora pellucida]|uniref:2393_t:CDS:1 n=1 Tax=Cetraspora pellucida TaxID=1433469 RepID=A0A9N9BWS5_9GLOM|nr:2393_t:CDS:10 [Cetraspora pellucida]
MKINENNYEKSSEGVNNFWISVSEGMVESKIRNEENEYDLTVVTNVNKQMGAYVNAITTRFTKRLLENAKESPPKRVAKIVGDDPNNPFVVVETTDENHLNDFIASGLPDESNSDGSYQPSSDGLDDDTFVEPEDEIFSETRRRRTQYIRDWFTGPGIMKSTLSADAEKWVIGTLDISNILLEYRDISVHKIFENKVNEVSEILSLNHIFLFERNVTSGLSSLIEPESLKIVFDTIKNEFDLYYLSNDDVFRCHKMAETASNDFGECKLLLRKWQKNLDDNQEDLILETFESMSTDVLGASVHRKRKFDPSLQGRKADFSIYIPIKGKKCYLLTSEVKSANYILSNKNKITSEDCDLVKLGNGMKDIIDKCIEDGVEDTNLIICGFQCRVYAMDLKYEAIYRMILLGKFYLPRDSSDFGVLPTSIERLMQVKNIMNCSAEICKRKIQNLANNEIIRNDRNGTPLNNKMMRTSFHTPLKVQTVIETNQSAHVT